MTADRRFFYTKYLTMSKVAIIGAGSIVFTKQFLNDMFNTPCMSRQTPSPPPSRKTRPLPSTTDSASLHNDPE